MKKIMLPLLITSGEPAGIGPELCSMLTQTELAFTLQRPIIILGDAVLLNSRAQQIQLTPKWKPIDSIDQPLSAGYYLYDIPLRAPCIATKPDAQNAPYVLALLDFACDACLNHQAAAMITAPLQKSAISPLLPTFKGHTEYLAARCKQEEVVMMLVGGGLKVALATTHLPLAQVPQALNQQSLTRTLQIMLDSLSTYWALERPRILVTGLNPHAGENGTIGREEIEIITPVIQALQQAGHAVSGPYPADTLFQPKHLRHTDAVLAMYHDQGLPVLKFASFGQGVNISLGLPIIRTSVDHGTALDLAGTNKMDIGSLLQAIECAHHMDLSKHS